MIYERGKVIRIDGTGAEAKTWVQVERSSACNGCKDKNKCSVHSGAQSEVAAINKVGAFVGDTVEIAMQSSVFLKTSFLVYIIPVVMLLVGAGIGAAIADKFGFDSNVSSVACGLGFMSCTFIILMLLDKANIDNKSLIPSITKIIYRLYTPKQSSHI